MEAGLLTPATALSGSAPDAERTLGACHQQARGLVRPQHLRGVSCCNKVRPQPAEFPARSDPWCAQSQESELTPTGSNLLDGRYAVFGYIVENEALLQVRSLLSVNVPCTIMLLPAPTYPELQGLAVVSLRLGPGTLCRGCSQAARSGRPPQAIL